MGIATFLKGCRLVAARTVSVLESVGGVMRVINGIIGAIETREAPVEMFRCRRRRNKNVLGNQPFRGGIHILLEAVQGAFTWECQVPILERTAR